MEQVLNFESVEFAVVAVLVASSASVAEAFELQTAFVVSVERPILAGEELLLPFLHLHHLDIWRQGTAENYNQIIFSSFEVSHSDPFLHSNQ